MTADDCWPRVTSVPVSVLGLSDSLGRIEVGAVADLCVVESGTEDEPMTDGRGEVRYGRRWRPKLAILGGEVV